jgi:hypothetical protein
MAYRDNAKPFFNSGSKPTQQQFYQLLNWLRFLDDQITIQNVSGLLQALQDRPSLSQVQGLIASASLQNQTQELTSGVNVEWDFEKGGIAYTANNNAAFEIAINNMNEGQCGLLYVTGSGTLSIAGKSISLPGSEITVGVVMVQGTIKVHEPSGSGSGGTTLVTPAAPTLGAADDSGNTQEFIPVPGYAAAAHEYRIRTGGTWGAWTACTTTTINVGNIALPVGDLEIRVAAVSGVNNAGATIANTQAFTVGATLSPLSLPGGISASLFGAWTADNGYNTQFGSAPALAVAPSKTAPAVVATATGRNAWRCIPASYLNINLNSIGYYQWMFGFIVVPKAFGTSGKSVLLQKGGDQQFSIGDAVGKCEVRAQASATSPAFVVNTAKVVIMYMDDSGNQQLIVNGTKYAAGSGSGLNPGTDFMLGGQEFPADRSGQVDIIGVVAYAKSAADPVGYTDAQALSLETSLKSFAGL